MVLTNRDGQFISVNPAFCQMLGYTAEELTSKTILEVTHPDNRAVDRENVDRLWRGKIPQYRTEKAYITKTGELRWGSLWASLVSQADGEPRYALALVEDLTERRRAEEALRLGEQHLHTLFESMLDGYAHCKMIYEHGRPSDFVYLDVNQAFGSLTGLENVVGRMVSEVIPGIHDSNPELLEIYGRVASTGQAERFETYVEALRIWLSVSVYSPVEGEFVAVFDNIADRKQAEQALRRRAEELAALQATVLDITVQHDLHTLLQTIVERAAQLLGTHSGGMYLCDPARGEARCAVSYNTPQDYTGTILKYGEGAAGTVAQTGKPLIIDDYRMWGGRASRFEEDKPFTSILSVPMIWNNQVSGVIHILDDIEGRHFTQTDLELLTQFASHAAIAVENARLHEDARAEVTERRRAEELLREKERGLCEAQRIAHVGSWRGDLTGPLHWSEEAYRIYGVSPDTFTPTIESLVDLLHPEDRPAMQHWIEACAAGQSPDSLEFRAILPDGSVRFLCGRGELVLDAENKPAYVAGTVEDTTYRKQVEVALRESEARFKRLVSQLNHVIWSSSTDGSRVIEVNEAFVEVYGRSVEEYRSNPQLWIDMVHPEDRKIAQASAQELVAKGRSEAEYRILKPDGTVRWILDRKSMIYDDKGNAVQMGGVADDITERKQAEQALRESEEQYRGLVTAISDGVFVTDNSGVLTFANPALARIVGLESPDQLLGRTFTEFVAPSMSDEIAGYFRGAIETGRTPDMTIVEAVRADGRHAVLEVMSTPITGAGGVLGSRGVLRDITARRRAEEALSRAEEKYRGIFENATEAITQTTPEGRYITANPAAARMLGYESPEDLITNSTDLAYHFYVQPDRRQEFMSRMEKYETATGFESEVYRKDGSTLWITENSRAIYDDGGNLLYYEGTAQDITERKRAEQALQRKARELQALYETSLEVSAQSSLHELLSAIVARAASLLGTDSGGLYLMQPDGKSLRLLVGHNLMQDFVGVTLGVGEGLSGDVAQTGKAMYVEDYETWPGRSTVYQGAPFRRVLAIPLRVQERTVGVINVTDSTRSGPFSDDELRLGTLFAAQAALAIESARLHEQERARSRELATLYASALAISSNLSLDAVLRTVVEQVIGALGFDECAVSFLDHAQDSLVTMTDYSPTVREGLDVPGLAFHLEEYPATRRALESQEPLFLSRADVQGDPAEIALLARKGMGAVWLLPLVARGQVMGLMELYLKEDNERAVSEEDMRLAKSLSSQTAIFLENSRLFERAEQRLARTLALHRIDRAITGSTDVGMMLKVVLDEVLSQLGAGAAVILLYNRIAQTLDYASAAGFHTEALQHTRLPIGQGYAGRAALERKVVRIADLRNRKTDFLRSPSFSQEGFVSYFGVPLIAKGELKGVLEIFHRSPFVAEREWLDFLETLAGQAAMAIESAALFEDLQRSNMELTMAYDATIEGWSRAMDLRDHETEGHSQRVAGLALELGRVLGLPEDRWVHFRRGALLHDLGKMGVPDAILQKAGPLAGEEWTIMRRHPTLAYEMLAPIQYLLPALEIPYCHHEKWDGTGYPRGLKGEQIPLAARIFAVIDVYDALTSDRPYRAAWSDEKAREHVLAQSGTHFEPRVAEAFLRMLTAESRP